MKNRESVSGALAIFSVGILYGMYGIFTRFTGQSFTAFSQGVVKNSIAGVLALVLILVLKQKWVWPNPKELPWMLTWLITGLIAMILMFVGFNNLPIGLAYFLLYSTMISSGLLVGKLLFGEKLTPLKILSFVFSLLGLVVIYVDSLSFELPAIFILLAGICLGIWNTVSKKFSSRYSDLELVAIDGVVISLASFFILIFLGQSIPAFNTANQVSWLWIVIHAISQVISISLMIYGFKRIEAQVGSLILPIEVVAATVFGYFFFREVPTLFTFIGGGLIGTAAILPGIEMIMQSKNRQIS